MPEQSKFSGALARLREPKGPPAADEQPAERATEESLPLKPTRSKTTAQAPLVRGRGRPPGKRSDPDFKPTTLLLREETKKQATRKLEDGDTDQDLSELVEQLLADWIKRLP